MTAPWGSWGLVSAPSALSAALLLPWKDTCRTTGILALSGSSVQRHGSTLGTRLERGCCWDLIRPACTGAQGAPTQHSLPCMRLLCRTLPSLPEPVCPHVVVAGTSHSRFAVCGACTCLWVPHTAQHCLFQISSFLVVGAAFIFLLCVGQVQKVGGCH